MLDVTEARVRDVTQQVWSDGVCAAFALRSGLLGNYTKCWKAVLVRKHFLFLYILLFLVINLLRSTYSIYIPIAYIQTCEELKGVKRC